MVPLERTVLFSNASYDTQCLTKERTPTDRDPIKQSNTAGNNLYRSTNESLFSERSDAYIGMIFVSASLRAVLTGLTVMQDTSVPYIVDLCIYTPRLSK